VKLGLSEADFDSISKDFKGMVPLGRYVLIDSYLGQDMVKHSTKGSTQ